MKNILYTSILLFIGLFSCSDDNVEQLNQFVISSKNIADNSLISGGKYQILNSKNEIIANYALDYGTLKISGLSNGSYTIEEIMEPTGYISEEKQQKIELNNTKSKDVVFYYINEKTRVLPESLKLKFYASDNYEFYGDYNAIRIGEYYWIDKNFNHTVRQGNGFENDFPITQMALDKYLERIRISPSQFQLSNIKDFTQFYGNYYSYPSILYMNQQGFMVNEQNKKLTGWKLPSPEDYRQLFAMSPFNTTIDSPHTTLNERDVRFALGAREGDNKLAYDIAEPGSNIYITYWFDKRYVTNMYKFNLMPGGARLNGDGTWCNELGPILGCHSDGKKGDLYHLFYAAYLAVDNPKDALSIGAVMLHTYVDTKEILTYHYLNVRWCRRLTDFELGYKLYINSDQSDIKKLDLDTPSPEGYIELPHGYVRGFYIQYILNNPNPTITVKDIVNYSRSVEDNYVYTYRNNKNIIL